MALGNRGWQTVLKAYSEEAGITIEGDNKWLTLMKKSIQYQKTKSEN